MMKRFVTIASLSLVCVVVALPAWAQEVLPRPEQPFGGKIGRTAKESVTDFPKEVHAPKGAPNVLLILTDYVGFGATSTFGGPIPTSSFDRLAMFTDTRGAPERTQSSQRGNGRHHGSGHRIPRV
jgi:hypothetical protein